MSYKDMKNATNISATHVADLSTGYLAVAQKGNIGAKYIYAEQLRGSNNDIHILRGHAGNVTTPVVTLSGKAGGHTQTWEYSGRSSRWFVGTESSNGKTNWDKQIARVNITNGKHSYDSNTQLPRLAYLDRAGALEDRCANPSDLKRAEAAVSPDYTKFLLATVENDGTGHFIIFDNNVINNLLDDAEANNDYVDLRYVNYLESFTVSNFVDKYDTSFAVNSVQGYDLDNAGNIYISSQLAPDFDSDTGKYSAHHKQIVKIPTYARTSISNWFTVDLSANAGPIDIHGQGMHTELEGIQILGENRCYLTVAYHQKNSYGENKTVSNKIFEVSWND